jgi:hypothetical protein
MGETTIEIPGFSSHRIQILEMSPQTLNRQQKRQSEKSPVDF